MKSRQSRKLLMLTATMCGGVFNPLAVGMEEKGSSEKIMISMISTKISENYPKEFSIKSEKDVLECLGGISELKKLKHRDILERLSGNHVPVSFIYACESNVENPVLGIICIYKNESNRADIGVIDKNGVIPYLEYLENSPELKKFFISVDIENISGFLREYGKKMNPYYKDITKPSPLLWMYLIGLIRQDANAYDGCLQAVKEYVQLFYRFDESNKLVLNREVREKIVDDYHRCFYNVIEPNYSNFYLMNEDDRMYQDNSSYCPTWACGVVRNRDGKFSLELDVSVEEIDSLPLYTKQMIRKISIDNIKNLPKALPDENYYAKSKS